MVAKAVPADTGLKLLAAVMRSMGRAREYLVRIMMLDVCNILVIIFMVFPWKEKLCEDLKWFQVNV